MHHLRQNRITTRSVKAQPWESQQVKLYDQIQALEIDQPDVSLPFSNRLARDQQWPLLYTQRLIEEYKKFLFLAIIADHPVTPSHAVDQAWHLHLTYTHSYWDHLCAQILPRPLHHHPTQGGQQQRELFWDCYSKTLDSYERFFGYCAPADIWPIPTTRFRQAGHFRQVNAQDYWMIPKPNFVLSQQVFLNISRRPWSRVVGIALLTVGLVFSLDFLYHSAIASGLDLVNLAINPSAIAQASSQSDSYTPSHSEVEQIQNTWGSWWSIGEFFLIFFLIISLINTWLDSRCPICKRFWLVETTTRVLREQTQYIDGEILITRRCKCCHNTNEEHVRIPNQAESSSDFGCM